MKCIIPVAGYATRLFPYTQNFPKALIEIGGETMLDHVISKAIGIGVTEFFIISNDKYYKHFQERLAKQKRKYPKTKYKITIFNDKTTTNEDRLGGIGDIRYGIEHAHIDEDVLVMCGDNIFRFGLEKSYQVFCEKKEFTTIGYDVKTLENAKRFGIISVEADLRVSKFAEKPENPESTFASIGIYYYPRHILPVLKTYIEYTKTIKDPTLSQKLRDAPGNFPAWLVANNYPVYAVIHSEKWYDVGTPESLREAKIDFGEKPQDVDVFIKNHWNTVVSK